jgi:hypothetical protein
LGTLWFGLWDQTCDQLGVSIVFTSTISAVLLLGIIILLIALYIFGTLAQVSGSMVNAVVLQLQAMQASKGFAEIVPAVVSALACFAVGCVFQGALAPFTVLGFVAASSPHQIRSTDDDDEPLLEQPTNLEPRILLGAGNPFDGSIKSTCVTMAKCMSKMCAEPVQFLPQLVLLSVHAAILLIWIALYPLGILLAFSTLLWMLLEAQYDRFRRCTDPLDASAAMLPTGAMLVVLVPVSCIVLPLFFLGFVFLENVRDTFQERKEDPKIAGLLWLINIELVLMQLCGACIELTQSELVLDEGFLITYTVVIGLCWLLITCTYVRPIFMQAVCLTGCTAMSSGVSVIAVVLSTVSTIETDDLTLPVYVVAIISLVCHVLIVLYQVLKE